MATSPTSWPQGFPPGFAEKFVPERMLGRGSFGTVWLARQQPLDRLVALKVLHEEVCRNDAEVGRFTDEAKITARLNHPHIVVVMDHGVEAGTPWIAYEYLEGWSLRERLTPGGMPWREVVTALAQVADALEHAHAQQVLHRDIKPDNVIEVRAGHYKVADFGLARRVQQQHAWTRTGAVVGSPAYLAPEIVNGEPFCPASDQYALGITLYELLTGNLPFVEKENMPVMLQHLQSPPPRPGEVQPAVPKVLDELVERMLAKSPGDRLPSMGEVKAAMGAALRTRAGRPSKPLPRISQPVQRISRSAAALPRRPGPLWWALSLALPAALLGAFYLHRAKPAPDPEPVPSPVTSVATADSFAFKRLRALPQPPRAVRVEYELDRVPAAGAPLPVAVDGVARTPVRLASVEGSLVISGVAPGARVQVGDQELTAPRGLPAWIDVDPSAASAMVSVRLLEPVPLELTVVEAVSGAAVHRARGPRAHRFAARVPSLKPATRYTARVRSGDPARYLAPDIADASFTTLAQGAGEVVPDGDALGALARTRDPRVLPQLEAALKAASDPARRLVLLAHVAAVRDPAGFPIARAECQRAGLPADEESALGAAEALVASDPAQARKMFLELSNDGGADFAHRAAVEGLALLGGEDAVAALGRMARAAPRELGARAAAGLGALGGEPARTELASLIGAGQPGEAGPTEAALRALGRCGTADDAGPVLKLLRAPVGSRIKRAAVATLAGLGGGVADAELVRRIKDRDAAVAAAAAWGAGQRRLPDAVPALLERLRAGPSGGRVPRALGLIGDRAAVAPLRELVALGSAAPLLDRADALWALGLLGAAEALPDLASALQEGDLYTRCRAAEALGLLGAAPAAPALEKVAQDATQPAPVRDMAQRALRWIREGKRPRGAPLVVDPGFPPVRTGLALLVGETFAAEAQGLCLLDPAALSAPVEPGQLPPGARPARQALIGLVGNGGPCFVGKGETAPCARVAEGELVLYAMRQEADDRACGFFSVWVWR